MKLIGITGGIGAGKSVVSEALKTMGFSVYDSDSQAKKLMNTSDEIKSALISHFGDEVYDNNGLNRIFLAGRIFNNETERIFVNSIVHPVVCRDFIAWAQIQSGEIVFIESAILFECGLDNNIDAAIYVDALQDERIRRVTQRDKTDIQKAVARINVQASREAEAMSKSKYIIDNNDGVAILPQIENILSKIK